MYMPLLLAPALIGERAIAGLVLFASLLLASPAIAHEGHKHAPVGQPALHGGVMHVTEQLYLEVVATDDRIEIYAYDHDRNAIAPTDIRIDARAVVPPTNKLLKLAFAPAGKALASSVDAKGLRRYILELTLSHAGSTEKIRLSVGSQ